VTREAGDPRSSAKGGATEQDAKANGSAPREDEATSSTGDGEPSEQKLDLPIEAIADWGTDPREAGKLMEALAEEALVAAERDEYLDALRRLQADFDNFRKRSMRQQTELLERATEGLCVRLLPVLDAFDLATAHVRSQGETGDAAKALEQIDSLLRDTLAREGVVRIDAVGVPFDPTVHDAVGTGEAMKPADSGETGDETGETDESGEIDAPAGGPIVAQVMRAGYRLKSKVLRPAMVLVGS
jgi:molecular chaperone GrpE